MQDPGAAARTVRQLQDLGVSVAIDDFGTGHSSLALLRRVAANIIKIDRSFVNETVSGGREAAIADIVIGGGPQLGYETVGEGVETREQLDWLRSHGCRYVQGYAVAEPKPLDAFVTWMRSGALPAAIA
jgi:EAL domain-containing protein (putative c-di-GMP-specific phosphodiesterase class I)